MKQTGGEYSTNIQVQTLNYLPAITEERVQEIYAAEFSKINTLQQEARLIFEQRLNRFETVLLNLQKKVDDSFKAYGEPSFIYQLQNTMKAASQTDGSLDYALLSNLLCKFSLTPLDKYTKARVYKATEFANMLSLEALTALTAYYAFDEYFYIDGKSTIADILEKCNSVYKSITSQCALPKEKDWSYCAEMLSAVQRQPYRVDDVIDDIIEGYPGYFVVGVQQGSNLHKTVIEKLANKPYREILLVEHELHPGFLRIPVSVKTGCASLLREYYRGKEMSEDEFSEELVLLYDIYDMISGEKDKKHLEEVRNNFLEKWESYPYLKMFRDWHLDSNVNIYFMPGASLLCEAYLMCLNIPYPEISDKFFGK